MQRSDPLEFGINESGINQTDQFNQKKASLEEPV